MDGKLVFNIKDYGAVGDGKTLETKAIQDAIEACTQAGGGTVYVPPGEYMSHTIYLKDNVFLNLDQGATLMPDPEGHECYVNGFVRANNVNNIGITGKGRLYGYGPRYWLSWEIKSNEYLKAQGAIPADEQPQVFGDDRGPHEQFWPKWWFMRKPYPHLNSFVNWPGHFITLFGCENVWLEDILIDRQPHTAIFPSKCKNMFIRGVRIENTNWRGPNTDGISIDRCQDVVISDCTIFTGDDGIVIKGYDFEIPPHDPDREITRNITVTNCLINSKCNAFKIGTETCGDFENITFSNSVIHSPTDEPFMKSGIALTCVDGAEVRNITISNIVMKKARTPIFIRLGSRQEYCRKEVGKLYDVKIHNVVAYDALHTSFITAIPGHYLENISISDVRIITKGGQQASAAALPVPENEKEYPDSTTHGELISAYGLYCRHVKNLKIDGFEVDCDRPDGRYLAVFDDVHDLVVDGLGANNVTGENPVAVLTNVNSAYVKGSRAPNGTGTFVKVEGGQSKDITVMGNVFTKAKTGVEVAADVPAGEGYTAGNRE